MGSDRHLFWRAIPSVGLALASVFFASASTAATQRVAVRVAFVDSAEISMAEPLESGTSDQELAITSSPGREFTILTDPAAEDITVSYQ